MSTFRKSSICKKLLEKHLVSKALQDSQKRYYYMKKNLSPSIDFLCPRKAYYNIKLSGPKSLTLTEKDFSYENERAKRLGNLIHEDLQKYFEESGVLRLNETTLEDTDLRIKARIDSVIEINGELYLVELKSAKSYAIYMMESDAAPNVEHQKQIQIYFHLLEINSQREDIAEILQGRTITKGLIVYESKNDQKLIEYIVNKDDSIIAEIKKYAEFVWKHVEAAKEPKVPFDEDSYECSYCPYFEKCHGKPKPEKFVDKGIWGAANAKELSGEPKF